MSGFLDDSFEDTDRVRVAPRRAQSGAASARISLADTDGDLGQALQLAGLTGNFPRPGAETMEKQHARLLDAFWDSEGRDPNPDGDPEFWRAYNTISKAHTGQEPATVPDRGPAPQIPSLADDPATDWERMDKEWTVRAAGEGD